MSCKTEKKEIDDTVYSVTQWPATKALTKKIELLKHAGPIIVAVMGKSASEIDETNSAIPDISSAFTTLNPDALVALIKSCIIDTVAIVENDTGERITPMTFETQFSGDSLGTLYKVFIFVLQVNYANLFKGQKVQGFLAKINPAE